MNCPICNGEMFDNRLTKKNPKGPDFRCKDKNCKFEKGKDGGWIASQYTTSVWLPKEKTPPTQQEQYHPGEPQPKPPIPPTLNEAIHTNGINVDKKSYFFAYAKDTVVPTIKPGDDPELHSDKVIVIFRKYWEEVYGNPEAPF